MISRTVILVIGPSWWAKGFDPHLPKEIEAGLPRWWTRRGKDTLAPIDIRAYLADVLRQEHRLATLMEAEGTRRTEEMDTKFFVELIEKLPAGGFVAFWPKGASPAGLLWELPLIVERVGTPLVTPETVHVFPQEGVGDWNPQTGFFEFRERTYRTTYHKDLTRAGFQIWKWRDYPGLIEKVRRVARSNPPAVT